jgi:signal transduction protein with GAF and PtsI domain
VNRIAEGITVAGTQDDAWHEQMRDVADRLYQPADSLRALLSELVTRAVHAVGSAEGSILVPDADGQHLSFFVSHSPKAEQVTQLHVPIDRSISGHVFHTGQMMAMSDLQEEHVSNFYDVIDKTLGVATRTYLALPILAQGRALGVATYVNRPGEPPFRPFAPEEMATAQRFAAAEAVVLQSWQRTRQLAELASRDLTAMLEGASGAALDFGSESAPAARHLEPWAAVLEGMHQLSEHDQAFCAELVALVARHAQG